MGGWGGASVSLIFRGGKKRFCSAHLDSSGGYWRLQTALLLAVSLWPFSAVCMSAWVSWLLRSIHMLSEAQRQTLYGHSWQTATPALLVNILGASVLFSLRLCAPHLWALIWASGNQKTEHTVTEGENKTGRKKRQYQREKDIWYSKYLTITHWVGLHMCIFI